MNDSTLDSRCEAILDAPAAAPDFGDVIGRSRAGRSIRALRCGRGPRRVSLLGGCHADEPVGPRLLRHVCGWLAACERDDPLLTEFQWWIIPHINPDGEARNRAWYGDDDDAYDLIRYLRGVERELPGDDIEFGFPRTPNDEGARPENRAAAAWWQSAGGSFHLHASLHGMGFAAGPWFLLEPAWADRLEALKARCLERTRELGYTPHDVERHGEKGFVRLGRGFTTRPDSRRMREHFLAENDPKTAALFRPSSMETIRSLGGDPLTIVSEMPLFLIPGVGVELGPPDPVADAWRKRITTWRARLHGDQPARDIGASAQSMGLRAMAVRDQMRLQWTFIAAAIAAVE